MSNGVGKMFGPIDNVGKQIACDQKFRLQYAPFYTNSSKFIARNFYYELKTFMFDIYYECLIFFEIGIGRIKIGLFAEKPIETESRLQRYSNQWKSAEECNIRID